MFIMSSYLYNILYTTSILVISKLGGEFRHGLALLLHIEVFGALFLESTLEKRFNSNSQELTST